VRVVRSLRGMSDTDSLPTTATPEILSAEFTHSAQLDQFAVALSAAQGAFVPAAQSANNPHFKKDYTDLSDVWDVIRVPFATNAIAVCQPPANKVGASTVTVHTMLIHKSGQWMRCSLTCSAAMNNPQSIGSVVTYLRRYGLMGMAGVTSRGEDDDGETGAGRGASNGGPPPAQRQQAPANKPASQTAPAAQTPPAAPVIPEVVKPFAERFEKLTTEAEFRELLNTTRETFDDGTPEKKAYVTVVKRTMVRLGIESKKPAPTTGATP